MGQAQGQGQGGEGHDRGTQDSRTTTHQAPPPHFVQGGFFIYFSIHSNAPFTHVKCGRGFFYSFIIVPLPLRWIQGGGWGAVSFVCK